MPPEQEAQDAARDGPRFTEGKLFLGGLDDSITARDLEAHCAKWGEVAECAVMDTKNFGFVTFEEPASAMRFLEVRGRRAWEEEHRDHVVRNRRIDVKAAVPKHLGGNTRLTRKLFVGGTRSLRTEEFVEHFAQFGTIEDAVIVHREGVSRGFGFVTFSDEMSVEKCLVVSHMISGKKVELKRAIPKEEMEAAAEQAAAASGGAADGGGGGGAGGGGGGPPGAGRAPAGGFPGVMMPPGQAAWGAPRPMGGGGGGGAYYPMPGFAPQHPGGGFPLAPPPYGPPPAAATGGARPRGGGGPPGAYPAQAAYGMPGMAYYGYPQPAYAYHPAYGYMPVPYGMGYPPMAGWLHHGGPQHHPHQQHQQQPQRSGGGARLARAASGGGASSGGSSGGSGGAAQLQQQMGQMQLSRDEGHRQAAGRARDQRRGTAAAGPKQAHGAQAAAAAAQQGQQGQQLQEQQESSDLAPAAPDADSPAGPLHA
ncbi:MAG: hypothetical protein J3K34DRAFT_479842 [Monoraphidium minutum]|nr:MAG: hypothetical protein J3K34DRAFT_479842 [Monoraphidium minutum]